MRKINIFFQLLLMDFFFFSGAVFKHSAAFFYMFHCQLRCQSGVSGFMFHVSSFTFRVGEIQGAEGWSIVSGFTFRVLGFTSSLRLLVNGHSVVIQLSFSGFGFRVSGFAFRIGASLRHFVSSSLRRFVTSSLHRFIRSSGFVRLFYKGGRGLDAKSLLYPREFEAFYFFNFS